MNTLRDAALLALALALVALAILSNPPPVPPPPPAPVSPVPPVPPAPVCPDDRCPRPREARVGGARHEDGTEVDCDLPTELHVRNRGGSDGAGLCVFASMRHAGLWASEPVFTGLFEFMFQRPGGGYPEKVDRMIGAFCKEKGLARPSYLQIEGSDLEVLRTACRAGLLPGVTYYQSPTGRYGGARLSHMVSLVHAGPKWFCILDNNYPGSFEWMTPEEFRRTYTGGGKGWALILLEPGPPPVPCNLEK